ncbi:MAG TPA: membrane protein insertase YidC, partial [Burkholderiales bacterium]|nr:membrane protein insertase YidC [Burkholderiales bacterium]
MDSLRLFAAIIFLVSVFLLYEAWVKERNPQPAAPQDTAQQAVTATPSPTLPPGATTQANPGAPPARIAAPSSTTLPVITVRTDVLNAEIDPVGGVLRRLEFTRHKDKVDKDRNFVLFEQSADHTYVAQSGLIGENLPNHTTAYHAAASNYQLSDGSDEVAVTLTAPVANHIGVTKRITFSRGSYLVNESFQIFNGGSDELKPFAYFQFLRDGKPAAGDSKMVPTYTGTAVYTDQSKFRKLDFGDIDKGKADYPKHVKDGWIAFVQHYFVAAWLPPGETAREFYTRALGNGLYTAGVIVPAGSIAPRASGQVEMRLYAGPQEQEKLA